LSKFTTLAEIWKEYIRKFLKIKLETSEFTCSEKEYRRKARKFDVKFEELKRNPGMRFISKICLNSLWGKFGQNPNVKHSEYIDNERDFYRVILNDKIEQISLSFSNDNMVYASYETKDEFLKVNYNTNIYIACFTSSWARFRLYNIFEKLERARCYVIVISGDFLFVFSVCLCPICCTLVVHCTVVAAVVCE